MKSEEWPCGGHSGGKRGAVGNCAHKEEKMKTSLAERRKAREGDEEEEEKENKETL